MKHYKGGKDFLEIRTIFLAVENAIESHFLAVENAIESHFLQIMNIHWNLPD